MPFIGVLAAVVVWGEPECAGDALSCLYRVPFSLGAADGKGWYDTPKECELATWDRVEACLARCPNHLAVSLDGNAVTLCLQPDAFEPFDPARTMSLTHNVNGRDATLKAPSGSGCYASDYSGGSYDGAIVVVEAGACAYDQQARLIQAAGGIAGVVVNTFTHDDASPVTLLPQMTGNGSGLTVPMAMLAPMDGTELMKRVRGASSLAGRWVFTCDVAAATEPLPAWRDRCPATYMTQRDLTKACYDEQGEETRLCARCPLHGTVDGTNTSVCVHGNRLLPRQARNVLHGTGALPLRLPAGGVVVVEPGALPDGGCSASDYAAFAGKVVVAPRPTTCVSYAAVAAAEAAGAAGFIVVGTLQGNEVFQVPGPSALVTIPVHAMSAADGAMLLVSAKQDGEARGGGYSVSGMTFAEGEMPPYTDAPQPPPEAKILDAPERSVRAQFLIYFLIPVMVLLLLAVLWKVWRNVSAARRLVSEQEKVKGIPLSAVSIGLSLTLTVVVLIIGIVLTTEAGERASNSAMADSQGAADQAYAVAIDNVEQLGMQLRNTLYTRITTALVHTTADGGIMADTVVAAYSDQDEKTFASFDALFSRFSDIAGALYTTKRTAQSPRWLLHYAHHNGYRLANTPGATVYKTDEAGNAVEYQYVPENRTTVQVGGLPRATVEGDFAMQARLYGVDTAHVVDFRPDRYRKWVVRPAVPDQISGLGQASMVLYTPSMNRDFQRMGVVAAQLPLKYMQNMFHDVRIDAEISSATMALLDAHSFKVLVANDVGTRCLAMHPRYDNRYLDEFYTLGNAPSGGLNLLGKLLQGPWILETSQGVTVRPRDKVARRNGTVFALVVDQTTGRTVDTSGQAWRVDFSTGSIGTDPSTQLKVMEFNGQSVLHIQRELTTDIPHVAATEQRNADGSWNSTHPAFQHGVRQLADGKDCVLYKWTAPNGAEEQDCYVRREGFGVGRRQSQRTTLSFRFRTAQTATSAAPAPQLFSDSVSGGSSCRVYANGRLSLSLGSSVCDVPPVADGLPANEWTTLSAAWDHDRQYCAVYINGALHAKAGLTMPGAEDHMQYSHAVGAHFVGSMSAVVAHDYAISAAEATALHDLLVAGDASLGFQVPSEDREWYVDVHPFNKTETMLVGMDWLVTVMLPRGDVMREIQRDSEVLLENLKARHAAARRQLDSDISETVLVAIVLCLLCCIVFTMYNERITRPFEKIARVTLDVSVMKINLDDVPEPNSWIAEVYALQKALVIMTTNLGEYRTFVEQSALVSDSEVEDEESVHWSDSDGSSNMSRSAKSATGSVSKSKSGISRSHSASQFSQQGSDLGVAPLAKLMLSLTKKRFSMTMLNLRGFHQLVNSMGDPNALLNFTADVMEDVQQVCRDLKGVLETFSGDRYTLSFGASKQDSNHPLTAPTAANLLRKTLAKRDVNIAAAVVTGTGLLGNAGNNDMRKYSFFTPVVGFADALLTFAGCLDLSVLCSADVKKKTGIDFVTRMVSQVTYEKTDKGNVVVYEIVDKNEGGEGDEWMYELEKAEANNPTNAWNKYAGAVFKGDWQAALEAEPAAEAYDSTSIAFKTLHQAVESERYIVVNLDVPYPSASTWDAYAKDQTHSHSCISTPASSFLLATPASMLLASPAGSVLVDAPKDDLYTMFSHQSQCPLFDPTPPRQIADVANNEVTKKIGGGDDEFYTKGSMQMLPAPATSQGATSSVPGLGLSGNDRPIAASSSSPPVPPAVTNENATSGDVAGNDLVTEDLVTSPLASDAGCSSQDV
eukprot:TRINITY_DN16557_c0_g1_i1.p1 TRINITY_DN16557_c0_g1~~TRINITY_DN16557_c0_g1_i1.p1  ORF type:complete len:1763 (+),score=399.22 TRINITY_DN16557_c0_g1_i1:54-5342(+)